MTFFFIDYVSRLLSVFSITLNHTILTRRMLRLDYSVFAKIGMKMTVWTLQNSTGFTMIWGIFACVISTTHKTSSNFIHGRYLNKCKTN